jgi:glycosyltransferase involved in cell wall biosynthesis
MTKRLLAIMPVINLWEQYTKWALNSLECGEPWDILLIDNGSTDGTQDVQNGFQNFTPDRPSAARSAQLYHYLRNDPKKAWLAPGIKACASALSAAIPTS